VQLQAHVRAHAHTRTHAHAHTNTHTHTLTHTHTYAHVHTHTHTHAHVHTHTHICTRTHAHIHTFLFFHADRSNPCHQPPRGGQLNDKTLTPPQSLLKFKQHAGSICSSRGAGGKVTALLSTAKHPRRRPKPIQGTCSGRCVGRR